jgi:hypothetical protein
MTHLVFVDANQYLRFYGSITAKKYLEILIDKREHILVPAQIVDEVLRNKLNLASTFFGEQFKGDGEKRIPDHLLGIDDKKLNEYRKTFSSVDQVREELQRIASDILKQISQSSDPISMALAKIFGNSVEASADELRLARERKERGNPPGKRSDPLGDQICWEQLLTRVGRDKPTHIWIITSDQDYSIRGKKSELLNPLLWRDLIKVHGEQLEVHCFQDLTKGLDEFAKSVGVASNLPSKDEVEQIKKDFEIWDANIAPAKITELLRKHFIAAISDTGAFPLVTPTQIKEMAADLSAEVLSRDKDT